LTPSQLSRQHTALDSFFWLNESQLCCGAVPTLLKQK
jgi:hypothetical protein